ncbi:hypothetical protein [Bartonella queenslandensis]|uniref:hypothetical protein n=1 Tax=Bartonella queenslandensis TaxID=481138 RepID=UPI001BAB0081|nr:hypothetical protein [Bartonella queenslandensis]
MDSQNCQKPKDKKHTTTIPILIIKNQKLALHAAKEQRESRVIPYLSAFLIGVEKTTSALKAMRCASIVIPAFKSWKTPERPAPSLLQDVLILAMGCKNDWSG